MSSSTWIVTCKPLVSWSLGGVSVTVNELRISWHYWNSTSDESLIYIITLYWHILMLVTKCHLIGRDAYVVLCQKEGNLAVNTSGGNVTLGQLLEQMTCMHNQLLTILLIWFDWTAMWTSKTLCWYMSALIPGDLRGGKASIETSGGHFIADIVSS
jgi:hypothetical protein